MCVFCARMGTHIACIMIIIICIISIIVNIIIIGIIIIIIIFCIIIIITIIITNKTIATRQIQYYHFQLLSSIACVVRIRTNSRFVIINGMRARRIHNREL